MISVTGTDFQTHELRHVSPAFKDALIIWQAAAPNDKLFCTLHGKMEEISIYVPETIAFKADRVEREQELCGAIEAEERGRIDRDIEAGRTRSVWPPIARRSKG